METPLEPYPPRGEAPSPPDEPTTEEDEIYADAPSEDELTLEPGEPAGPSDHVVRDEGTPEADADADDDRYWERRDEPDAMHPLGPLSEPAYEEADFSVVDDPEPSPTVRWRDESELPFGPPPPPEVYEADAAAHGQGPTEDDVPEVETPEPTVRWSEPADEPPGEAPEETVQETPDYVQDAPDAHPPVAPTERHAVREPEPVDEPRRPGKPADAEPSLEAAAPTPAEPIRSRTHRVQHGPNRFAQEQDRSRAPIFIAGAVVVVLVAALGFWFLSRSTGPTEPAAPPTAETQPGAAADTTADADTTAAEAPPAEAAPTPEGPLRGSTAIDPAAGGYTIIVASDPSRETARSVAERYAAQGFRTGVLDPEVVRGRTYHRVGVGQFETDEAAVAARAELAGDAIPSDAWILALR